jgi:hypothetical protein
MYIQWPTIKYFTKDTSASHGLYSGQYLFYFTYFFEEFSIYVNLFLNWISKSFSWFYSIIKAEKMMRLQGSLWFRLFVCAKWEKILHFDASPAPASKMIRLHTLHCRIRRFFQYSSLWLAGLNTCMMVVGVPPRESESPPPGKISVALVSRA